MPAGGRGIPYEERVGKTFGYMTILELTGVHQGKTREKRKCLCRCKCGKIVEKIVENVVSRDGTSCGCARRISGNSGLARTYSRYKSGAKNRGYSFNISREQFDKMSQDNCHYCGCEPKTYGEQNGQGCYYNGLDRVDNDRGYEPDNVVTCCITCNRAKHNMSYDEFKGWMRGMIEWQLHHQRG